MTHINESSIKDLREKINSIKFCMFTTVNEKNGLSSRPMTQQALDDDGTLWFFTSDATEVARELTLHPTINLGFADPSNNVYLSISGEASLEKNPEKATELWNPMVAVWYPQGLSDPSLRLIKFKIHCAEYWDSHSNKMLHLFSMAKAAVTGDFPKDVGKHEKLEF